MSDALYPHEVVMKVVMKYVPLILNGLVFGTVVVGMFFVAGVVSDALAPIPHLETIGCISGDIKQLFLRHAIVSVTVIVGEGLLFLVVLYD